MTNTISTGISYLLELRKRLLRSVFVTGMVFIVFCYFAKNLYHGLMMPALSLLPQGKGLLAIQVGSTFLIPLKFAFIASIFVTVPYFLYQMWRFVEPALYTREKRLMWILLLTSTLLFYLGVLFSYFVVLPLTFKFFVDINPSGVEFRPDISQYLDFSLKLLLAFGFSFEVPILTFLLIRSGWLSYEKLKEMRAYVIVVAFVIGMFLMPDVLSQTFLALPLWLLFEIGLFLGKWI